MGRFSVLVLLIVCFCQSAFADKLFDETMAAAQKGDVTAQLNLAEIYLSGQHVARDNTEAVKWFTKAAEQGNVAAQVNLGAMYYSGRGVEKNYETAQDWFSKAADQGSEDAKYNLEAMKKNHQMVDDTPLRIRILKNIFGKIGSVEYRVAQLYANC